jgi:hypothetical protein
MDEQNIISITTICARYQVPATFIYSLCEYELLETIEKEGEEFIPASHLHRIEKMIRLHYELDINMEGLDAINNLLQQVWNLQEENQKLKDRLNLYE